MMRGYDCYYFAMVNGKLFPSNVFYCWYGIIALKIYKSIFISQFRCPETEKYIDVLIDVINQITKIDLVDIEGIQYIKYDFMDVDKTFEKPSFNAYWYNKNLILLSFIRNLWHEPIQGYTVSFFEALLESGKKDPMEKLTWANQQACKDFDSYYSPGHCNVNKNLKVKTLKQFNEAKISSTAYFLTQ